MTTKRKSPKPTKADLLHIRVSAEEKQAWAERAQKDGRDLSGWVRFIANREAAQPQ